MPLPLFRELVDAGICPDCNEPVAWQPHAIQGRCHPTSDVLLGYEDGVVTIHCATCGGIVVQIETLPPPTPLPTEATRVAYWQGALHVGVKNTIVVSVVSDSGRADAVLSPLFQRYVREGAKRAPRWDVDKVLCRHVSCKDQPC